MCVASVLNLFRYLRVSDGCTPFLISQTQMIMNQMKILFFCFTLLIAVVGGTRAFAQTLVLHLANGTIAEIELTTDFNLSNTNGKTIIFLPDGNTQEFAQNDILSITYKENQGDVNRDGVVDVADIATIISIMAGDNSGDDNTQTFDVNGVSFTMVEVKGGTFWMGAQSSDIDGENYDTDAQASESPVHSVTLSTFSIGQTEVTQELWHAVMGNTPTDDAPQWYHAAGLGNQYPAYFLSWYDCHVFIARLNQLTGKSFRLPTEAEWEYAARGGNMSKGYKYSGGNTIDDVAWYVDNNPNEDNNYATQPVATKAANELGLYDMSGNVYEWCEDRYDGYIPQPRQEVTEHVMRGGNCWSDSWFCRVACRNKNTPEFRSNFIGLRLAL